MSEARTEEQIERVVEREMDKLDLRLLDGRIGQDRYDDAVAELAEWAEAQFRKLERQGGHDDDAH